MRRVRTGAVPLLLALVVLAGCDRGPDDEMVPRPAETVTVTGTPRPAAVPDRLPLVAGEDPGREVVWARGSVLHVRDRETDLGTLRPDQVLAVPGGLLVLASGELWSVQGRDAVGVPLTPVTSLALSDDGTQVLLDLADRERPVGYAVADGARVEVAEDVSPRSAERVRSGPGRFDVDEGRAAGTAVLGADGAVVDVAGLPADFAPLGWVDASRVVGLGSLDGTRVLHSCDLDFIRPACRALERPAQVRPDTADGEVPPPVLAGYPAG